MDKKIKEFFTKELAIKIADIQKKADIWYYERNEFNHASWLLDQVIPLKEMANKYNICDDVYKIAYTIYDFRNSGRYGYTLKDGKITNTTTKHHNKVEKYVYSIPNYIQKLKLIRQTYNYSLKDAIYYLYDKEIGKIEK